MVACRTPPNGNLARNPGICPDWELNQRPLVRHSIHWATPSRVRGLVFIHILFDPFALAPPLFQVQSMESILNYYATHIIYPSLNGKQSCYWLPHANLAAWLSDLQFTHSTNWACLPSWLGTGNLWSLPSWSSHFVGKAYIKFDKCHNRRKQRGLRELEGGTEHELRGQSRWGLTWVPRHKELGPGGRSVSGGTERIPGVNMPGS